jgi:hypothetical protein
VPLFLLNGAEEAEYSFMMLVVCGVIMIPAYNFPSLAYFLPESVPWEKTAALEVKSDIIVKAINLINDLSVFMLRYIKFSVNYNYT